MFNATKEKIAAKTKTPAMLTSWIFAALIVTLLGLAGCSPTVDTETVQPKVEKKQAQSQMQQDVTAFNAYADNELFGH